MISIIDPLELRQVLRPTVYAASLGELPPFSARELQELGRQNAASFAAPDADEDDVEKPAA